MAIPKSKRESLATSLFENTIDGYFLLDTNFKVIDCDSSFEKNLKYTSGTKLFFNALFVDQDFFKETMALLKKKKRIQNHEAELKTRTGRHVWTELNVISHKDDSGNINYLGFFFDVSKRKKAEKELLQIEKRLAAGKLSRILAHEVRNPLTNVQLALEQLRDEFEEKAQDAELYFDVIKRNSERIGNLITALLNSSRPRTATLQPANLNTVILQAIELVKDRLTLKNIELNLNLSKQMPSAKLDTEQIKIALINIMVNAIEAMSEGNGILRITSKAQKKSIQFSITDDGIGMTSDELEQLFEPFYSKKRKGTGLGLTTVQNIIHAHSGTMHVKSTPGDGSVFTFTLPINR